MYKSIRNKITPSLMMWSLLLVSTLILAAAFSPLGPMGSSPYCGLVFFSSGLFGGMGLGILVMLLMWFPPDTGVLRGLRMASEICYARRDSLMDSSWDITQVCREEANDCGAAIERVAVSLQEGYLNESTALAKAKNDPAV